MFQRFAEVQYAMTSRPTRRYSTQLPPPRRQPPTGWRALLIGIAFGFSAGFLFTIGIISLINANTTSQAQAPVGNNAASASATAAPTPTATFTPTAVPTSAPTSAPTFAPTSAPTSAPLPAATPAVGGTIFLGPDDPAFYVIVTIIFLILSGFVLLRPGSKK